MNILVHGFNVKDPEKTVGKLKPYVKDPIMFEYGWFGLISVLLYNKREAGKLKVLLDRNQGNSKSVVYAHSNGCAIAVEAARQGAKIDSLICINPALKCDTEFPDSIKTVLVIHTEHDRPTKAARFFDKIPFVQIIVPNAWGAMGAKGYTGTDNKVRNWNLSEWLKGHSDFFKKHNLDMFMDQLNKWQ